MEHRFFGTHPMKMDDKGRVQVPADFRRTLDAADADRAEGDNPVVYLLWGDTRNPWFTCHSEASMARALDRLAAMPAADPRKPALRDYLSGNVDRLRLDDAGRLVVRRDLRDLIHLDRAVTFKAQVDTFRLMSAEVPTALTAPLEALIGDLDAGVDLDSLLPDL